MKQGNHILFHLSFQAQRKHIAQGPLYTCSFLELR